MGFELRFDKVVRIDSLDLDLGCWDLDMEIIG